MIKTILIILLTAASTFMVGQSSIDLLWEKQFENEVGDGSSFMRETFTVSDGYLIAGEATYDIGFSFYLAKYDNNGQKSWEVNLPSQRRSWFTNIEADNQENIYVAGVETVLNFNDRKVRFARISPEGNIVWEKTYLGKLENSIDLMDMKVVGDNLYLCGSEKNENGYDLPWLAKYDLDGNLIWDKSVAVVEGSIAEKLAVGNDEQVVIVGSYNFERGFLAAQYSSSGTEEWIYEEPTDDDEMSLVDVVIADDDNAYSTGYTAVGVANNINTLKISPSGNVVWADTFETGYENVPLAVYLAANGSIITVGTSNRAFKYQALVTSFDDLGNQNWQKEFIVTDDTEVDDVARDENGNMHIAVDARDSCGVFKVSSSGILLDTKLYFEPDNFRFINSISASNGKVAFSANRYTQPYYVLAGLNSSTLSENFIATIFGSPLSNEVPGKLVSMGQSIWQATSSDDGDTTIYAISKFDQAGNVQWRKETHVKSGYPNVLDFLKVDKDGNAVGYFYNRFFSGDDGVGLIKFDSDGNEVFFKYLDTAGGDISAGGLALDPSGNIYIIGANRLDPGNFLSKYDPNGNLQWRKKLKKGGSALSFIGLQLEYTQQNKLVLAASADYASNDRDLYLLQFDQNGILEWDVVLQQGFLSLVSVTGLEIFPDGEILIAGNSGGNSYVCSKYDINGNELWKNVEFLSTSEAIRSMSMDNEGNIYLAFSSNDGMDVRKIDPNGNELKKEEFSFPSPASFHFPSQMTVVNGRLAIFGNYLIPGKRFSFELLLDPGLSQIYVHLDSTREADPFALALDPAGFIYVNSMTGDFSSSLSSRKTLLKKYAVGVVGIPEISSNSFGSIYTWPNPVENKLYFSDEFRGEEIITFDMTGAIIFSGILSEKQPMLDVLNYYPGVYGYRTSNGKSGKFIKMK